MTSINNISPTIYLFASRNESLHSPQTPTMRSTIPLLSLASVGLNILSVQSAAIPNADLARRAEEPIARVYLPNSNLKREAFEDGITPPDVKRGLTAPDQKRGLTPPDQKREAFEDGITPPDVKRGLTSPDQKRGLTPPDQKREAFEDGITPPGQK
jgi:hypothetical protein